MMGEQGGFGRRARSYARSLVLLEMARHGGERDRIIVAVAGAHAERPEGRSRRHLIRINVGSGSFSGPEQLLQEPARLRRGSAVLRSAIILRQRLHQGAPLAGAVAAGLDLL